MDVEFIVFDRVEELDLVGPWEMVGLLADRKLCNAPKLVTLNVMEPTGEHGMRFVADTHFSDASPSDVVVVPGGRGGRTAVEDERAVSYLRAKGRTCKALLSVCTGSFLLQRAGLLNGRRATTHWRFRDHLKDDPGVTLAEERFVRDGNVWTAGGVSAGMDMMLAFIAQTYGESVASDVQLDAEYFPLDRIYGRPFEREDVPDYIRKLSRGA